MRQVHDFKKYKAFLVKCSKEQNIYKHNSRKQKNFDIIFIQEPLWSFILTISSLASGERDRIVNAPSHLL